MTTIKRLDPPALHQLRPHPIAQMFRPPSDGERQLLRESLQRGYDRLHPIVVTPDNLIVDGCSRRGLACELELTGVPIVVREFADDAEIAAYVIGANLARRHLSRKERRELAGRLVNEYGLSTRKAGETAGVSKDTAHRGAVDARSASVSNETPRSEPEWSDEQRLADLPADLVERVRDGMDIDEAEHVTRQREKRMAAYVARVHAALDVLGRMVGYPVPAELSDALSDDERDDLDAILAALAETRQSAQDRPRRHASTKDDSTIVRVPAA
jgi:hypothetical protein